MVMVPLCEAIVFREAVYCRVELRLAPTYCGLVICQRSDK